MKDCFEITIAIFLTAISLSYSPSSQAALVSAGQLHTCVWDGSDMPPKCFGDNEQGQLQAPQISRLVDMQSGAWHTCALHEKSKIGPSAGLMLSCWGHNGFRQLSDDRTKDPNPIELSVGRWHNCALHQSADGRKIPSCWGRSDLGQSDVPRSVIDVESVFAGSDFSCALLSNADIQCWGGVVGKFRAGKFPDVKIGGKLYCQATNGSIQNCWTNTSPGVDAQMRAVSKTMGCALANGQVACNPAIASWHISNLLGMAVGDWHVCAYSATGYECQSTSPMGREAGQIADHNREFLFGPVFTTVEQTPAFLNTLSDFLYQSDAEMIGGWSRLAANASGQGKGFIAAVTRHFLLDCGYKKLQERFLFQSAMTIEKLIKTGEVPTLNNPAATPEIRQIAARMMSQALVSSRSQLPLEGRKSAEELITDLSQGAIGAGSLNPEQKQKLTDFMNLIKMNPLLEARVTVIRVLLPIL